LVGAITLYLLAKSLANAVANLLANPAYLALGHAPLLQEARNAPVMALLLETAPHLIFVATALHQFRPGKLVLSDRQRETIRFLNPVCFTIASLCLAFAVAQFSALLGGALILLSVLLYVLRSAKWQSDFRRLKNEIAATVQSKTNFLLDINHEIRSPLTSICLNAARLNRETGLTADQTLMAKAIHGGGEMVISTLNDILNMSRLESGALPVAHGPFHPGPALGEAASTVAISGKVWLGLFVAAQGVMIALVLLWPRLLWLPFL
jgi:signal transduction histidine kinase